MAQNRFDLSGSNLKSMMIMVAGLAITIIFILGVINQNQVERNAKLEYITECNEIRLKISSQLKAQAGLLRTGSSFFAIADTVTRETWRQFYESLRVEENYPGIQGFGFTCVIPPESLVKHTEQIRKEGFPEYSVRPSGERPLYTSIVYLEPFRGRNLRAFGYDMYSEPVRRKAMELSRDSNSAILSGKVVLVQETNENVQWGTLMYVPVYRKGWPTGTVEERRRAIKGWVYSPYRMEDLMAGMLGRWDQHKKEKIHLEIFDDSVSAASMLYTSQAHEPDNRLDHPDRTITLDIDISGKKWILLFTQMKVRYSFFQVNLLIILGGGLIICVLLFGLFLSLVRTQARSKHVTEGLISELKAGSERFKILLNSTAEAIYGLDTNGNCTFSNHSCLQLLGYERNDQLLGKNVHELIHHSHADGSRYAEEDCHVYKSFRKGEGTHVDNEVFWRADGTSFPVEYWSYPIYINGHIEGSVVTFFDITERKQSERVIRQAIDEASKANQAKSEFLSRMSHELRTPLNAILGFAQLMEMGEMNPMQKKGVRYILNSGKHLLNLINEVLDISRIESGNMSVYRELVQLDDFTVELVDTVRPLAAERQIELEIVRSPGDPVTVFSDRVKLKQIWINLLNNAIKYNRPGGKVRVILDRIPPGDSGNGVARVSFTDTGIGISRENLEKLFVPFERIGAENVESEGTGLGLAVVKKLAEVLELQYGVESSLHEGSTFWIELPLADSSSGTAEVRMAEVDAAPQLHMRGTLFYIEDNFSNIELVDEIISTHRPEIRLITAGLGGQAVEISQKNAPDLILLDLNLPDMHGSQVVDNLRAVAETRNIPVVIISADAMSPQVDRMIQAGVKDYLTKPLDIVSFLKAVDRWI